MSSAGDDKSIRLWDAATGQLKLVGTTASVICLLEDADYEGHSLSMLRRIAAALHRRVEIRFVRDKARPSEHHELRP